MSIPLDKPIYLIYGDSDYCVEQATDEIISALVPQGRQSLNLDKLDGRTENLGETLKLFRDLRDALFSIDLFGGGNKTVWLKSPSFLMVDKISKLEGVKNGVASLAKQIKEGLPEGSRLIISTQKINRASVFYKACAAGGYVQDTGTALNTKAVMDQALMVLDGALAKCALEMSYPLRRAFLERTGTEPRVVVSEIEKLSSYCGERRTVQKEDIEAITSRAKQSPIWDFTQPIEKRARGAAVSQIKCQLEQGENAIRLANSAWSLINDMLLVKDAVSKGWADPSDGYKSLSWAKLPPEIRSGLDAVEKNICETAAGWRLANMLDNLGKWSLEDLRKAREEIYKIREELVSSQFPEQTIMTLGMLKALGLKKI